MNEQQNTWPLVTVCIVTYKRPDEIRAVIDSHLDFLRYPADRLRFHIADDGSGGLYVSQAAAFIAERTHERVPISHSITDHQGWGANVNNALRMIQTDYIYLIEDDYVLLKPLDLKPNVALMEQAAWIGMVRFGIAGHEMNARLHEIDIRRWLPDYRDGEGAGSAGLGRVNVLELLHWPGGAYSFYRYSNRPHLRHTRFHRAFGPYAEGLGLAETEHAMNFSIAENPRGPAIVVPLAWALWFYDHIGASRQGTEEDVGHE